MNHVITIDGPTGSGKSTVSRLLAKRLQSPYLDTGAMYRVVALALKQAGIGLHDKAAISKICNELDIRFVPEGDATGVYLGRDDVTETIREPDIDLLASDVSALEGVRSAMTRIQRKIGSQGPLVAEGRDMGTVVFPEAQYKFYIDASLETRIDRRFQERQQRGESISREKIREDLIKRDHQDMHRSIAPLKPAKDATIIDTTELSLDQVVEKILREIEKD
ncbi:MAG: (d)CMP kinase [Deltaproteobacteria bacterium]|nr:(d)CMP kinase [Deltaproteobacteria bacterium]MBW2341827.1 (d)CMP kinase [Deltaproteobacteria bacterium]